MRHRRHGRVGNVGYSPEPIKKFGSVLTCECTKQRKTENNFGAHVGSRERLGGLLF